MLDAKLALETRSVYLVSEQTVGVCEYVHGLYASKMEASPPCRQIS